MYPLIIFALCVGAACGLLFVIMGLGTYLDMIDPGPDFRAIDPWTITLGGVATIAGAFMGALKFRAKRRETLARVKAAEARR
ncbi:hypothetical protein [Yoonia sp. 2307UL14-13]|uniref:hypothetical protein n=1 Tax=Yoonia sp. 2307UL14-13 TaxID=3126506 RepID=UPI0030B2A610